MKFLTQDDKTQSHSDTTLRTWLLFGLFFFTALAMIIIELIHPGWVTERAITLLDVTAFAAGAGGALYLGKRINERNHVTERVGDYSISGPRDRVSMPKQPPGSEGGAP